MGTLSRAIIIGNLGADPEIRHTASGKTVAHLKLATNDNYIIQEGKKEEKTDWHDVSVFGPQSELCEKYLTKGRRIYVDGKLKSREWEDQNGSKRKSWEIIAQRILFLDGPKKNLESIDKVQSIIGETDEDIPF